MTVVVSPSLLLQPLRGTDMTNRPRPRFPRALHLEANLLVTCTCIQVDMNKISAAFAAVFTTTEVEVSMWQGMPLPLESPLALDGTPNTTLKVQQPPSIPPGQATPRHVASNSCAHASQVATVDRHITPDPVAVAPSPYRCCVDSPTAMTRPHPPPSAPSPYNPPKSTSRPFLIDLISISS